MNTGKKLLTISWLSAIALVVTLGIMFNQESQHFFGITDNREQAISFPHPVEILEARVVEGEEVAAGTLMLRLGRPDLRAEAEVLDHQLAELEAHHLESTITLQSEIAALEQEKMAGTAALNTDIDELEKLYRLDLAVMRSISSEQATARSRGASPRLAKLAGLRNERHHVAEAADSRIESIRQRLEASEAPALARLAELRSRRTELSRQQANLTVTAKNPGRVGSVLFRPGDQVPAFAPILTLHGLSPELAKGYIHEDVHNEVSEGQQVWVRSLTADDTELLIGTVESLGARIVAYPDRLLKNKGVPAWGREVVVRLDRDNRLLLGERVAISLQRPLPLQERVSVLLNRGLETIVGAEKAVAAVLPSSTRDPSDIAQADSLPLGADAGAERGLRP